MLNRLLPLFAALGLAGASSPPGPSLFEPGLVSTGFDDSHVAFAPDGETMYFLRSTPDFGHWTILVSERQGGGWSAPAVAPFSGRWSDADVFVTRDGRRLLFISNRPVDGVRRTDTDLWMMERRGNGWSEPAHIPELSSPGFEWFPTMTDSGVIYFGSERAGGRGTSDIWRARWLGARFSEPENLGAVINGADQEIEPLIARDESFLIFAARGRAPGAGQYDLYISYNCQTGWTPPAPLGAGVNSPGWDFAPRFSPDGQTFYFTSNRRTFESGGEPLGFEALSGRLNAPGNGLRDVYSIPTAALGLQSPCVRE